MGLVVSSPFAIIVYFVLKEAASIKDSTVLARDSI